MNRFFITSAAAVIGMSAFVTAHAAVDPVLTVPSAAKMVSPTGVTVGSALDQVRVFPNPWRSDKDAGQSITFDHIPPSATVKLFTVSGQFIKILDADSSGVATWDLTNDSSVKVASGLYLYLISTDDGQDIKGKLAIIR